jgi:hypothetical protein
MKIEMIIMDKAVNLPGLDNGRGLSQTDHGVLMEYKDGFVKVFGAPPKMDGRLVNYMIPLGNILMMESEDAYKARCEEEEKYEERLGFKSGAKGLVGAGVAKKSVKAAKGGGVKGKG